MTTRTAFIASHRRLCRSQSAGSLSTVQALTLSFIGTGPIKLKTIMTSHIAAARQRRSERSDGHLQVAAGRTRCSTKVEAIQDGMIFPNSDAKIWIAGRKRRCPARANEGWMNAATENSLPRTNAVDSIKTRKEKVSHRRGRLYFRTHGGPPSADRQTSPSPETRWAYLALAHFVY
jgi:hypothetical protein